MIINQSHISQINEEPNEETDRSFNRNTRAVLERSQKRIADLSELMGSSQNFSIAVEMFGAEIDDVASQMSEKKNKPYSFNHLGKKTNESRDDSINQY